MPKLTVEQAKLTKPQIGIYSFGAGTKGATGQFEFDVTSFRDPTGQKQFANLNGTYPSVQAWMEKDKKLGAVIGDCLLIADDLVKPKELNGNIPKSVTTWLSFAFKDHHGKWAAPAIAEIVGEALSNRGYTVVVFHAVIPKDKQWTV